MYKFSVNWQSFFMPSCVGPFDNYNVLFACVFICFLVIQQEPVRFASFCRLKVGMLYSMLKHH